MSRSVPLALLVCVLAVLGVTVATPAAATPSASPAATTVCSVYCDTRDPSLATRETFPVPNVNLNGRLLELHVSDPDGMAWASVDNGVTGDQVWLDRSWDGGSTWDGLLGEASIPSTWTGTRTLMYNLYDPAGHRRGLLRACANAGGVTCTRWAHPLVCATACDGASASGANGDNQPVAPAILNGRTISLHLDRSGMAWGTISGGRAGDEVWLDRSWNEGSSWPDGSSLGRLSVASGATGTTTATYHVTDPAGLLYGGVVRACGRAVEGQNGSCTTWARPTDSPAADAADALLYSYDPNPAWWPSSWWNSAATLTTVEDYLKQTGTTSYDWIVNQTFVVNKGTFPAGARGSDPILGDFTSQAVDDSEWWGVAWVAAYDLTGDSRYLTEAETIANYANGFWDTGTCGGGVWWNASRSYKNAVTNGLYVVLNAELHNRLPGDTTYLGRARAAWTWFTGSGLINASGLVNDGLTSSCANNGQTVWTYNQGLAIGAGVEMSRATGNAADLTTAEQLGNAAMTSGALTQNGVLTESCDATNTTCDDNQKQFKGVFMRYFAQLTAATGNATYRQYEQAQANAVWSQDRDVLNHIGERWSGADNSTNPNVRDWRTQASGLAALLTA